MRGAHDLGRGDLRLLKQGLLDLDRGDVFAAADNDVFDAAREMQHTLFIELTQVTGVQPAILIDGLLLCRQAVIAIHQARTFDDDFTDFACSDESLALFPDTYFVVGQTSSDRYGALFERLVAGLHRDDRRALGLAVAAQEFAAAEQLLKTHHLDRRRKAAADDAELKLAVEFFFKFRHGCEHAVDRTDRAHVGDPVRADQLQQRVRLEERRQVYMSAGAHIGRDDHQAVAVECGQRQAQFFAHIFPDHPQTAFRVAQDRE